MQCHTIVLVVIHVAVIYECEENQQCRLALLPFRAMQRYTSVPDVVAHSVAIGVDVITRSAVRHQCVRHGLAAPAGLISFTSDAAPWHRAGCDHSQCIVEHQSVAADHTRLS